MLLLRMAHLSVLLKMHAVDLDDAALRLSLVVTAAFVEVMLAGYQGVMVLPFGDGMHW